jgi:hypothetical protein
VTFGYILDMICVFDMVTIVTVLGIGSSFAPLYKFVRPTVITGCRKLKTTSPE